MWSNSFVEWRRDGESMVDIQDKNLGYSFVRVSIEGCEWDKIFFTKTRFQKLVTLYVS